jgi:hypothetical protein
MRGRLQIFAERARNLDDLFEAYEVAAVARDRFQKERDCPRAREYETLCSDIEADVISYLLQKAPGVPD